MKVIFDIPTLGDHSTLAGGIVLRHREGTDEFIVHNYSLDENGNRAHFQGSYYPTGSEDRRDAFRRALIEFARRAERATGYETGGAIDFENLGIPKGVRETLEAGLERRADLFFETEEAFGDYTDEDREQFHKEQNEASRWLSDR